MRLDIRLPIGLMFAVIGAFLVVYGVALSDKAIYERSLGININFWWGAILLAFGVVMFWLGPRHFNSAAGRRLARRTQNRAAQSAR